MNKSMKLTLGVILILFIGFGLVYSGIVIGGSGWINQYGMFNSNFMPMSAGFQGESWMHSSRFTNRWMGGQQMMGRYGFGSAENVEPLTMEEVDEAIHKYLEDYSNENLVLGEIMIFDNHAYAQIIEKDTGIGATEVLIDPRTLSVFPEQGPNMMWNLKYSSMGGAGMMNGTGMMSGLNLDNFKESNISAEEIEDMPVSSDQAVESAQAFLDQYYPGTEADKHADRFYGYYTIHVVQEDGVVGMLSVNGFSGQVFYHNWHGEFLEMSEH